MSSEVSTKINKAFNKEEALKYLYSNENNDADVIFLVHGEEIKAHKSIIVLRCEVLKGMMNTIFSPADGRHLINDPKIEVETFKQFIKFLYLDECDVNSSNIGALLHISDMYLVESFKEYIMKYIMQQCKTIGGILENCELGILYEKQCPEMLQLCFQRLSETHFQSFVYSTKIGPNRISAELVERIAKDCPRSPLLNEDILLLKIFEWGQMECKQQNIAVEPKGMKRVLSPIVKHIKLDKLSISSLANIIYPNELAPPDQYIQYLVHYITGGGNGYGGKLYYDTDSDNDQASW